MLHIKYMYGNDVDNAIKDRLAHPNTKSCPSCVLDAKDIYEIRKTIKYYSQNHPAMRYNLVIVSRTLPYKKLKSLLEKHDVVYQECNKPNQQTS